MLENALQSERLLLRADDRVGQSVDAAALNSLTLHESPPLGGAGDAPVLRHHQTRPSGSQLAIREAFRRLGYAMEDDPALSAAPVSRGRSRDEQSANSRDIGSHAAKSAPHRTPGTERGPGETTLDVKAPPTRSLVNAETSTGNSLRAGKMPHAAGSDQTTAAAAAVDNSGSRAAAAPASSAAAAASAPSTSNGVTAEVSGAVSLLARRRAAGSLRTGRRGKPLSLDRSPAAGATGAAGGADLPVPSAWTLGGVLRSHMAAVRHVAWLPCDERENNNGEHPKLLRVPLLLSASGDGAVKVWAVPVGPGFAVSPHSGNSSSSSSSYGNAAAGDAPATSMLLQSDMEPIRTFRGHRGPVLCGMGVRWPLGGSVELAPLLAAAAASTSSSSSISQTGSISSSSSGSTEEYYFPASPSHLIVDALRRLPRNAAQRSAMDAAAGEAAATSPINSVSSIDCVIVSGGSDGQLLVWLKPCDSTAAPALSAGSSTRSGSSSSSSDGGSSSPHHGSHAAPAPASAARVPARPPASLPPPAYDLPAAVSLPVLTCADAHSDAVWGVAQAPPGHSLTGLLESSSPSELSSVRWRPPPHSAAAAPSNSAGRSAGTGSTPTHASPQLPQERVFSTSSMPLLASASADGMVHAWCFGVHVRQSRRGPSSSSSPSSSHAGDGDGESAPSSVSLVRVGSWPLQRSTSSASSSDGVAARESASCIAFDPTSPALSVLVGTSSGAVLRLDLDSGRVTEVVPARHSAADDDAAAARVNDFLTGNAEVAPAVMPSSSFAITPSSSSSSAAAAGPSGPSSAVAACLFHPVLPYVFVAREGSTRGGGGLSVHHARSRRLLSSTRLTEMTNAAVDPTGLVLATSSNDGDVRVWSVESRACVWTTKAHKALFDEAALCVAFHPTRGSLLCSGGGDGLVKVWVSTGAVSAPSVERRGEGGSDDSLLAEDAVDAAQLLERTTGGHF